MDMLRLVLLIVGLFVIVGVYLWERRRHLRAERPEEIGAPPPGEKEHVEKELERLSGLIATARSDASLEPAVPKTGIRVGANALEPPRSVAAEPKNARPAARAPSGTPRRPPAKRELVIALTLMAPPSRPFSGPALVDALAQTGMEHGELDIFHRYVEGNPEQPLFSIANVVEPGTIDPAATRDFKSPGLAVFMRLPNATKPTKAFKEMLDTVDRLAHLLGGIVCDNRRRPLDAAGLQALWDDVLAFDGQVRTARI
jgi:cell division protein ZipA